MTTHAKSHMQWQSRLAEYEASGLTMREWCEQNGVRDGQLRYWLTKAKKAGESRSWACVEHVLSDAEGLVNDGIFGVRKSNERVPGDLGVVVRVGAACIEVRRGFDPSLLSQVLRVVSAIC